MENQGKDNHQKKENRDPNTEALSGLRSFIPPASGIQLPVQTKGLKTFTPPSSGIRPVPVQKKGLKSFTPPGSTHTPLQFMAKEEEPLQMKQADDDPLQMMKDEEEPLQKMKDDEDPLQMKAAKEEDLLQKKGTDKPSLSYGTNQNNGTQSMPEPLRMKMESAFGHDFSNVKIHESSKPAELGALAYTQGNNIHFAPGQYNPESQKGQELLGHELAHVVQQQQGKVRPTTQFKGMQVNDDSGLEKEADEMGKKAADAQLALGKDVSKTSVGIQDQTIQKKDELDIKEAIQWYKSQGKNVIYSAQLAEDLYKAAGSSYKSLYENTIAEAKIGENFVRLVAAAQSVLTIDADGKLGSITRASLSKFQTGGAHGLDYGKLFKDKKLEIGVAVGDEFDAEAISMINYLTKNGFTEKSKSTAKNTYTAKKSYKTPGDNTAGNIDIEVIVDLTWSAKTNAKDTYADFLANKEVAIYSGHARYGTGPDFDEKDSTKGNFVIGKGYDKHMNDILKSNKNDLQSMSGSGKFDMKSYQAWFFNACSSTNYKDEIRGGHVANKSGDKKSSDNLRFMGTKHSIVSDALPLLQGIIEMKSMDQLIKIMNDYETKNSGEKKPGGYYTSD
jgi:hypothetical protein